MSEPEVPSPCVGICRLDAASVCAGCGRTVQEIAEWPLAGSERRLAIRAAAQQRVPLKPASTDRKPSA